MITIEDLKLPRTGKTSPVREELRRASLHLQGVVVRTAHVLGNVGEPGYHLTLVEALKVLKASPRLSVTNYNDVNVLLQQIGLSHARTADRHAELLGDVVYLSNLLDGIREEYRGTQSS